VCVSERLPLISCRRSLASQSHHRFFLCFCRCRCCAVVTRLASPLLASLILLQHDCRCLFCAHLLHHLQRYLDPCFREHPLTMSAETLEAAIIVSVLLSFVKNAVGDDELPLRKRLTKQVISFVCLSKRTNKQDMGWCLAWFLPLSVSRRCIHCCVVHSGQRCLGFCRRHLGVCLLYDCFHPHHRKSPSHL
jgi:hypothetical protein